MNSEREKELCAAIVKLQKQTFDIYTSTVLPHSTGHDDDDKLPWYATLGLTGEAGEVAELVKKAARPNAKPLDDAKLMMELGDVLWYIARIAQKRGFNLADVAILNMIKLGLRRQCKDTEAELQAARDFLAERGGK